MGTLVANLIKLFSVSAPQIFLSEHQRKRANLSPSQAGLLLVQPVPLGWLGKCSPLRSTGVCEQSKGWISHTLSIGPPCMENKYLNAAYNVLGTVLNKSIYEFCDLHSNPMM